MYFLKIFIYLFLERGRGRERERERNIYRLPLACPQLGTWPPNPDMYPDQEWSQRPLVIRPALNPLSHINQGYV